MKNVVIWGLNERTLPFLERCWVEFTEEFHIVAFTQDSVKLPRGGGG